jgi:putative ABC transport system substrate-binding protein
VTTGDSNTGLLLQATRSVPIVFVLVPDPVGAGFVASLARPGGNATGFLNFEFGRSGKWPELLKQIAPSVTRVAVLRDPSAQAPAWANSAQFKAWCLPCGQKQARSTCAT